MSYRGRFAPSPTGPLHFGSLVAAAASWLDARAVGGEWLVRIEDVDTPRTVPGAADEILRTLEAFGLHWDGEVAWQSRRTALYEEALARLRALGATYRCKCSRREISDSGVLGTDGVVYPGTCRRLALGAAVTAERFDVSGTHVAFQDRVQGTIEQHLERDIGDFIVKRRDALHAYQLAVVVDDADQGVTDVVRGADLLWSTPRQIALQRRLGLPTPAYLHVPIATNERGEKLSKQTLAPAADARRVPETLQAVLTFLGQARADGARPAEILAQAAAAWNPARIVGTGRGNKPQPPPWRTGLYFRPNSQPPNPARPAPASNGSGDLPESPNMTPQSQLAAPRGRRFTKSLVILVGILAVAGSLLGLRVSQANKEPEKKADRTYEFAPGDLAELRREPLGRTIPVSGTMKPLLQATVRSKVPAEVARVHVQEGQSVAAGAPLVSLDTADLKARHDAQMAAVAEARARLDLAKKNQANNKALLEKSFISQNAYDSIANSVQVAEANVKSAESQGAITQRAVEDAQVRAPFGGIVAKRWVNQGDKVSGDMPVAQIVDLSRMELEAQVPVSEIPFVKIGQEILFLVDGFQGRRFAGKIERVNPSAELGSRSISVFATLANADGALKGGMFANGTLATAAGAEVDVIPSTAVIEEGGQSFVYVVKGGKVERRSVVLGAKNVERGVVTVKEGLERGVQVITVKAEGLKPGAKAIVKSPAKAA